MKRSNRLILLIGVFLAVVAFVLIVLASQRQRRPALRKPDAAAAACRPSSPPRTSRLGARVTEDMLTTETIPVDQRQPGAYQDAEPGRRPGRPRQAVTAGQQITTATFSDGQLDQPVDHRVPEGQRAMSLQIDAVSGVGTIIKTGDFVDMIIGFTGDAFPVVQVNPEDDSIQVVAGLNNTSVKLAHRGHAGPRRRPAAARATRPRTPQPTPTPSGPAQPSVSEGSTALVILSLNAQQAEVIKFAQMQGYDLPRPPLVGGLLRRERRAVAADPGRHDRRGPEDPRGRWLWRPPTGARRGHPPGAGTHSVETS